ncbi:heat shock protein Hsp33 [Pontibacillus halophilus JSM 076056 = DSM 19796]|uniref:33 kDa chaperonin n=1 Tax=Pontibacillus halophilus JSM 076056 = DSM 19796 TaxID=1385510 RepID=A0A0A5I2J4_9BACI|nr:Hsp33 family molecular chaperone HslO [Pontibacillus halophilus]KGX90062.1 heat shock protein Hsp33 [Pontibacillus halophilus JSM 076056 = DSM 19796]
MNDYMIRGTAFNGTVRAYGIRSTNLVEEARRRHDTFATASAALGRTMTASAMIGSMNKGDDTITVKIEGGGPIGAIVADADAHGNVRGYVSNPHVDFDLNDKGKLDVARAVGTSGTLSIIKDLGLKDYFTGEVPIVSGEISEDFTYYFANSEQVPSAVGAGVLVNPDHTIKAAGGFIIQIMPGATDETIDFIEKQIQSLPQISRLIEEGNAPEDILTRIFGEGQLKLLGESEVNFKCRCSRERLEQAISGLGVDEVAAMIEEDHGAEATCHFCNEVYQFTEDELREIKDKMNG